MTQSTDANLHETPSTLSNKERAFVDLYFGCNMNATEAYSRLYPKATRDTCRANASKLLSKTNIQSEVSDRLTKQAMGKDEVLARLSSMARASEMPFIRITGEGFVYFDFNNPDAQDYLYLIKKIKTKRTRRLVGKGSDAEPWEDEWVEVELHDAQAALSTIAKYHGMLTDKVDLTSGGEKLTINVKLVNDEPGD